MSTASSSSKKPERNPQYSASPHASDGVVIVASASSVDGVVVVVLAKTGFICQSSANGRTSKRASVNAYSDDPNGPLQQLSLLQDPNKRK